ncbi:MAG: ABC transporter permease [Luteolibacter sp.]
MKHIWTIFKREIVSYFTHPIAYVVVVVFIFLSMLLTFSFGNFLDARDASLTYSFFLYLPLLLMVLVPAVGMRLWTDEQRNGTIELLGTFPISTWSIITGKFLAASLVWLVALILTFPIWLTVNYLGQPDNLMIFSGYLGAFMLCLTFLSITLLVSAFTRDQVICLVVSAAICILLVLTTFEPVVRIYAQSLPQPVVSSITAAGVWEHFMSLSRGLFRLQDFVWFGSIILTCLLGTSAVLSAKRA